MGAVTRCVSSRRQQPPILPYPGARSRKSLRSWGPGSLRKGSGVLASQVPEGLSLGPWGLEWGPGLPIPEDWGTSGS